MLRTEETHRFVVRNAIHPRRERQGWVETVEIFVRFNKRILQNIFAVLWEPHTEPLEVAQQLLLIALDKERKRLFLEKGSMNNLFI